MTASKIKPRPQLSDDAAARFISGAPDATRTPAAVPVPESAAKPAKVDVPLASGGRKKPISLTIEPHILAQLDRVAANLGISRASAFSLAVSRFVAQENREASK